MSIMKQMLKALLLGWLLAAATALAMYCMGAGDGRLLFWCAVVAAPAGELVIVLVCVVVATVCYIHDILNGSHE